MRFLKKEAFALVISMEICSCSVPHSPGDGFSGAGAPRISSSSSLEALPTWLPTGRDGLSIMQIVKDEVVLNLPEIRALAAAAHRRSSLMEIIARKPNSANVAMEDDHTIDRSNALQAPMSFTGEKLGVLPSVGDMGVGKTTLVQHVCDDERVRHHFPIILYSNFSYTRAMAWGEAPFVLGSKHAVRDAKKFIESLHVLEEKYLTKRFLLVFEDVDTGKHQTLEELLPILRHGERGSRIIVTTNSKTVAASMGTVQPVNLKVMPHQEYWFFFKAHAFAGRDVEEDPRMPAAGKAIARKLNGSFFGAKIVGGVLKAHPNPWFWNKVLRSNIG
ncbi:putative disease resistance protein RGA4 [Triticum dicoccoides]|uniref:putative disease resistance protein RGA4 n=1 Tax=Triticum dicoccoides TaxID=85692 RepID=UPI00189191D4|nr:putative disease resistance protein RGA4 [Triticum dicoccoides]